MHARVQPIEHVHLDHTRLDECEHMGHLRSHRHSQGTKLIHPLPICPCVLVYMCFLCYKNAWHAIYFLNIFKVHWIISLTREALLYHTSLELIYPASLKLSTHWATVFSPVPDNHCSLLLWDSLFRIFTWREPHRICPLVTRRQTEQKRQRDTGQRQRERPRERLGFLLCLATRLPSGKYRFQMVEIRENILIGHKAKLIGYRTKRKKKPHSLFFWLCLGLL